MLLTCTDLPTAIVCSSDMNAIGAMDAIHDAGLTVPGDFSVIGFDDLLLCEYLTPPLTTIRQNKEEIGRQAIDELIALINHSHHNPPTIEIPTELIIRKSCKSIGHSREQTSK